MQFDYLRPSKLVYNIKHDNHYIMHKEGNKIQRSVFQNVEFDPIEDNKITEVETQLQSEGIELPKGWNRGMTLKFCFTGDFKTEQVTSNIKRHLEWKSDTKMHVLTPEAQHFLDIGACYQFGRDHMHRPVVYIKISLVPTDINRLQPFLTALCYLLNVVQTYMCVPYYVERMRIIIDTKGISLLRLPCQVIKRIIEVTQHNYCGCLESMFLLDPPFIFRAASKIIQSFIHPDTQARMRILGQEEYSIMHRYIPESHMQKIHGGSHENLQVYWPIQIVEFQEETIYFSMHDHIYDDVTQSEDSQCQCNGKKNRYIYSLLFLLFFNSFESALNDLQTKGKQKIENNRGIEHEYRKDEDQIQKKVKLDDDQSVSQILEEEDIDSEEIEGLDVSEEEKEPIEDNNYIFIDKLPNQETALLKFQEQVRNRIKFYKQRYLQECYENQTKKSFVNDDAIPICADVRYLDFQKLHDSQLQIAGRLFDVIMMDPPWQLSSSQPSRGVAIAYQSLSDDMISKMPIQSLQDDGIILIWTINAKYKVTCKLMENWGYKIVDEIVWVKKTVNGKIAKGHGFYLQHAKENCLVGVKGNLDWERCKKSVASDVIFSERRGQSQKPEEIYKYVEELIPNGILYFLKKTSYFRALFGNIRKKKQYQEKLGYNRK